MSLMEQKDDLQGELQGKSLTDFYKLVVNGSITLLYTR